MHILLTFLSYIRYKPSWYRLYFLDWSLSLSVYQKSAKKKNNNKCKKKNKLNHKTVSIDQHDYWFYMNGREEAVCRLQQLCVSKNTKVRMVYNEALTHVHHADRRCLCLAYLCVKSTASKEHTKQPRHYTDTANGVWANGHGCHQMKECFTFTKQLVSVILVQNDFFPKLQEVWACCRHSPSRTFTKTHLRFIRTYKFAHRVDPPPYKMFYVQWFKRHHLKHSHISVLKTMTLPQPDRINLRKKVMENF